MCLFVCVIVGSCMCFCVDNWFVFVGFVFDWLVCLYALLLVIIYVYIPLLVRLGVCLLIVCVWLFLHV